MELPTCPACGQSVIDDDVDDCPFCGASMTGKPSTGTKPAPAKKKAKPKTDAPSEPEADAGQPASKKPPKKSSADTPEDDVPWGDEDQTKRARIRVRRKRTKETPLRVACPMCETAGFVPRKAAGKEVRCANPECLVPQFTVPDDDADDEAAAADAKPAKSSKANLVIIVPALLIVGGGIAWYFLLGPGVPKVKTYVTNGGVGGDGNVSGTGDDNGDDNGDDGKPINPKKKDPVTPTLSVAEIRELALKKMISASQQRRGNRNKPFCRRFTALTYAQLDRLEDAKRQLAQLEVVGSSLPYYRVEPLTAMAWQQLKKSDTDSARATVDAAWKVAKLLPKGQSQHAAAISLGALLIAFDRQADAESLIGDHREQPPAGYEDLSSLKRIVEALETYDLDAEISYRTGPAPVVPFHRTIAYEMVANGAIDDALKWAKSLPDKARRNDTLIDIAEAVTMRSPTDAAARVSAIASELDAANRARLMARVAVRQWMRDDKAAAKVSLAEARKQLASVKPPSPATLPDLKGIHDWKATNTDSLRSAALAAADIARLQAASGDSSAAWDSISQSLTYARGMAASPVAIATVLQVVNFGPATIQARLKEAFDLQSEDKAKSALNTYRRHCALIQEGARERFAIQVAVLSQALNWGVSDQVLQEIRTRQQSEDPNRQEPYFGTELPWTILDGLRRSGKETAAKAIEEQLGAPRRSPGSVVQARREAAKQLDAGQQAAAVAAIEKLPRTAEPRARWLLRNACRLAANEKPDVVFEFIAHFQDQLHREQACELSAAVLARRGQLLQTWGFLKTSSMSPTEMVSACRGLALGSIGLEDASTVETSETP